MKRLLMILLLGALGCGPDTTESVAALEKLGAQIILMPGQRGGVMVQWSGSGITDAGLGHLKGLPNLKILILADTQVTGAGVAEPKKALPKCRIHR